MEKIWGWIVSNLEAVAVILFLAAIIAIAAVHSLGG